MIMAKIIAINAHASSHQSLFRLVLSYNRTIVTHTATMGKTKLTTSNQLAIMYSDKPEHLLLTVLSEGPWTVDILLTTSSFDDIE